MSIADRITELVVPLLPAFDVTLYDVEINGGTLRITVDADGGVALDTIADVTRAISRMLDDEDPMPGAFTLEVSSPGLERRLRSTEHFAAAVGEVVSIKLGPQVEGDRRVRGTLTRVDDDELTVTSDDGERTIARADVTKATTVFEWGPAPKPGSPEARARKQTKPDNSTPDSTRKAAAQ